jgi:hypothetical protein
MSIYRKVSVLVQNNCHGIINDDIYRRFITKFSYARMLDLTIVVEELSLLFI